MSQTLSEKLTVLKIRELATILLKVQSEPTGGILEPLLDLLVGGTHFDLKQNFLIREPNVILLILELLPHLPSSVQLEIWSTFGAILHQCLPNATACHQLGLTEQCLEFLSRTTNDKIASYIVNVLEMLAGYSISVKQLRAIFSYLYTSNTDKTWARYSVLLVGALCNISIGLQPDVYFSFSGGHGSVLALPPLSKWPSQSGFTISTWIRAEKPFDQQREYYKPIVYWFRTGKGLGYSAHFIGSNLVIETVGKNAKKPQTHSIDYIFHSYQWHMVTLSYQYHRLRSSVMSCYVDGILQLSTEVTLPPQDERYDKCFLGGNHIATCDSVFQGQMAALYIWKECIDNSTVSALYKLGPSYKSQFKFVAEIDTPLTSAQQKLLFDCNLSSSMVISYNAKAIDGQLCLEASPAENESFFVHSPHATMLEGVNPIITTSFHSALHSLGGIQTFFPLFSQLDIMHLTINGTKLEINYTLSVKLLSLIFELARNSITYMYQIVQMKALELIGNLLGKASSLHITIELLSTIFEFFRYLSSVPYGIELLQHLVEHLLLNSKLWKKADKKVQITLYSQLATEFSMLPLGSTNLDLREIITVSYLMYVLKEHYSLVDSDTSVEIRQYILLIVKQFMTRGKDIEKDELVSILNYLASVPEEKNLLDVLKLLLSLVFEKSHTSLIKLLILEGGMKIASKLLTSQWGELRINALKLLNKILYHVPQKEQIACMEELLIVVKEKLLSSGQPISTAVFNILIEFMLNSPSKQVIETKYINVLPSLKIIFIGVFQLLIELITTLNHLHQQDANQQDATQPHLVLGRQLIKIMITLCSKSAHNCRALLDLPHWIYWVFKLESESKASSVDIHDEIYELIYGVLTYALYEEEEGWKVWVELTSTIHASRVEKVSSQPTLSVLPHKDDFPIREESSVSLLEGEVEHTDSAISQIATPLIDHVPEHTEQSFGFCKSNKNILKFIWSQNHKEILKNVLIQTKGVLESASGSKEGMKLLDPKQRQILSHNMIHVICLSVDSLINMVGGIKCLVSESCAISKTSKRHQRPMEEDSPWTTESLLRMCLQLYHILVLGGETKLSLIEARMNMEPGGVTKQSLRNVLVKTCLDCIHNNKQYSKQQSHYNYHKHSIETLKLQANAVLKVMGLDATCLDTYVQDSLKFKLNSLKECQNLLSEENLSYLKMTLNKDASSTIIYSVVYYLAVMCVAKYKNILDSIEKEKLEVHQIQSLSLRPQSSDSAAGITGSPLSTSSLFKNEIQITGDDALLANSDFWDEEDTSEDINPVCALTNSQEEGSVCSSVGSASDLHNVDNKPVNFSWFEEGLNPPSVLQLTEAIDVSEQVNVSLRLIGRYLCQLITDNKSTLSKMLTTQDGRQLLSEAAFQLAEAGSIVEITMLLCSQEWQSCLQQTAGKFFNNLLLEGKQVARFSESYFRAVASDIIGFIKKSESENDVKFTKFEGQLSICLSEHVKSSQDESLMRKADIARHTLSSENLWRQISIIVDQYGSFDFTPLKPTLLWKLDMKEDCSRRRMKLLPNVNGSNHSNAIRAKINEELTEEQKQSMLEPEVLLSPIPGSGEEDDDAESLSNIMDDVIDDEVPQASFECGLVVLTHLFKGRLSLRKESLTFTANESIEETLSLGDTLPINDRWNLTDITAVFLRRYLHQNKAIEVFFLNKTSVFLVLANHREAKEVVNRLPKVGIGPNYGLPQTRAVSLMSPTTMLKRCNVTEKWINGIMSNFDYLIALNTIAGRSFNDLSQYPVFPWILKDYTSDEIDLKNPAIYRDLSKPIGAQNSNRQAKFIDRYESWENDAIPPFHYGTHYSNLAFTLHWLVRVEPFTSLHINLQDGFFDHGSRLFSSIARSWNNCQKDSSDVKELIPELFYFPEILKNENKFILGEDEHDEMGEELPEGKTRKIDDVLLPPWAKSAEQFIHIHKQALESSYVSANLHRWIDLIFGFKQTGKPAQNATNVFYYLTYSGSVKWKAITDDKQLKAVEQQILQFGQTPCQLFTEPHPSKHVFGSKEFPPQPISPLNPAIIADLSLTLDVPLGLVQLSSSPLNSFLLSVSYNQLFSKNKFNYVPGTAIQPPIVSIDRDPFNAVNLHVRLGDPLDQSITSTSMCMAATPNVDNILMCGFWDSSFKIFSTDSGQLIQSVFGHRGVVTCISYSQDEGLCSVGGDGIIATGSNDVTVLVWKWSGKLSRVVSQLKTQQGSVTPLAILNGHEKTVTCVAISSSLGLVISGTKDGCCLLHTVTGELLHKLVPSSSIWSHPHLVISSQSYNHFIVHYADRNGCLMVFTCNGKQLAYRPLNEPALGLAVSSCGDYLVFGGFSGRVYVLNTQTLDVVYVYDKLDSSIRTLSLSSDNRFIFAGLSAGKVLVLATHFWRQ